MMFVPESDPEDQLTLPLEVYNNGLDPIIENESNGAAFPLHPNNNSSNQSKPKILTEPYDPYDYGNSKSAVSSLSVISYILIFSFGPTLFSIPSTFISVGYIVGVFGTFVIVLLYAHCMRLVFSTEYELCKRYKQPSMSYTEMARKAFECGPPGLRWCSRYTEGTMYAVFVCNWTIGTSCMFLLAAENLKKSVDLIWNVEVSVRLVMLYLLMPLTLLWWIPNLKLLLTFANVLNSVNVIGIGTVTYYALQDIPSFSDRSDFGNIRDIPLFCGVLLFTMNITGLLLPLKSEMKKPKKFNSRIGVINLSYCIITIIYALFGFLSYLKFGDKTQSTVIRNLPVTSFTTVLITAYGFSNCIFIPMCGYVPYDILWNTVLSKRFNKSKYKFHFDYACRTLLSFITISIAFVLPKIELFMLLTGTVCSSIDSLIIPALAHILVHYDQGKYFLFFKNSIIIILGVVLLVAGLIDSGRQLVISCWL